MTKTEQLKNNIIEQLNTHSFLTIDLELILSIIIYINKEEYDMIEEIVEEFIMKNF